MNLLAMKIAANPFAKVKELIQQLITRLLTESENEATQKGWCDTEIGKANSDRDFRMTDTKKLSAKALVLEAEKKNQEQTITKLTAEISELQSDHVKVTKIRDAEKAENKKVLEDSREGLTALSKALATLQKFYGKASRANQGGHVSADPGRGGHGRSGHERQALRELRREPGRGRGHHRHPPSHPVGLQALHLDGRAGREGLLLAVRRVRQGVQEVHVLQDQRPRERQGRPQGRLRRLGGYFEQAQGQPEAPRHVAPGPRDPAPGLHRHRHELGREDQAPRRGDPSAQGRPRGLRRSERAWLPPEEPVRVDKLKARYSAVRTQPVAAFERHSAPKR